MSVRVIMTAVVLFLAGISPCSACIRCEADDPDIRAEAEAGDARAQYVMAWKYGSGYHADQDDVRSFAWLKKAADNGYEHAVLRLDEYYLQGRGVRRDVREAIVLLERAAALFRGGEAAGLLADICGTADYGTLDLLSAHAWLSVSDRKDRAAALRRLERAMTESEKAAARKRAREWIERNRNKPTPRAYDFAP